MSKVLLHLLGESKVHADGVCTKRRLSNRHDHKITRQRRHCCCCSSSADSKVARRCIECIEPVFKSYQKSYEPVRGESKATSLYEEEKKPYSSPPPARSSTLLRTWDSIQQLDRLSHRLCCKRTLLSNSENCRSHSLTSYQAHNSNNAKLQRRKCAQSLGIDFFGCKFGEQRYRNNVDADHNETKQAN